MTTINQMIYDVRERLNLLSDDTEYSDRLLIHRINQVRSVFLLQHLNNFRIPTSIDIIQELCLETEVVSTSICGVSLDCEEIIRTKEKLPQILIKHTGPALISITTPDMFSKNIDIISPLEISEVDNRPFKGIFAFLGYDNHIYIYSTKSESYKLIDCITVRAVFHNPLDLMNFKNCCGCQNEQRCFDPDTTKYPILPEMESSILDRVIETFRPKLEIPEDKTNNADDK